MLNAFKRREFSFEGFSCDILGTLEEDSGDGFGVGLEVDGVVNFVEDFGHGNEDRRIDLEEVLGDGPVGLDESDRGPDGKMWSSTVLPKACAQGRKDRVRSVSSISKGATVIRLFTTTFLWVSSTPLGRPVVPLV